jgi:hypothetical protein
MPYTYLPKHPNCINKLIADHKKYKMDIISILATCLIAFVACIISVSVGGTSLITVPVLIWLGMTTKNAIATNMFALLFLSLSGALGFRKEAKPSHYKMIAAFSMLTVFGSLIGANLVLAINENILKRIIGIIMCIIAVSFLVKRDLGTQQTTAQISKLKFLLGTLSIFILGIYGGFFSGGYVTLLSYVLILSFGFNFLQAAFVTKVFNIFSSSVACAFFYYHGLINFSVGIPLAVSMFSGAFFGAKLAIAKGNLWIRNLFIAAVIALATKLLAF